MSEKVSTTNNYAVFFSYTLKPEFKEKQRTKSSNDIFSIIISHYYCIVKKVLKIWKINNEYRHLAYFISAEKHFWLLRRLFPWLLTFETKTSLTFQKCRNPVLRKTHVPFSQKSFHFLGKKIWRNALALKSKKMQGIFGETFILVLSSSAVFCLENPV